MMGSEAKYSLVTGATGFIGKRLCDSLIAQGSPVLAMTRDESDEIFESNECLPWVCNFCDVVDEKKMASVDTVFHLAAKSHSLSQSKSYNAEYYRVNIEGTRKLLEAAKQAGVRRFVFFSSIKAMGEGSNEPMDESSKCEPQTPYGRSKLEAEHLVLEGGYVPEPVVLRLSMVYGSEGKGNMPQMIKAIDRGFFPPLPEFNNKRSMVHVEDVVQAAILAAEKTQAIGQTYIVTDGQAYSTRQIYEWISDALGKRIPAWHIPIWLLDVMAKVGDGICALRGRRFKFDSDALSKIRGSAWYSSEKIRWDIGFKEEHHLRESLSDIVRRL